MPMKRGTRLLDGQTWSTRFEGYIDCGNGTYRRPRTWRGRTTNAYFVLTSCTHCNVQYLADKTNRQRHKAAFCTKRCRSLFQANKFRGKRYKKPRQHGEGHHVVVKLPDHPRASHQGLVFETHTRCGNYAGSPDRENRTKSHHINVIKSDNRPEEPLCLLLRQRAFSNPWLSERMRRRADRAWLADLCSGRSEVQSCERLRKQVHRCHHRGGSGSVLACSRNFACDLEAWCWSQEQRRGKTLHARSRQTCSPSTRPCSLARRTMGGQKAR